MNLNVYALLDNSWGRGDQPSIPLRPRRRRYIGALDYRHFCTYTIRDAVFVVSFVGMLTVSIQSLGVGGQDTCKMSSPTDLLRMIRLTFFSPVLSVTSLGGQSSGMASILISVVQYSSAQRIEIENGTIKEITSSVSLVFEKSLKSVHL